MKTEEPDFTSIKNIKHANALKDAEKYIFTEQYQKSFDDLLMKQPEPIETFFPTKKKTVYKKKGVQGWRGYKSETIKTKSK